MRVTRSAARKLLLLETPDEVALAIACALDSPLDLLRLSVSCRRFRLKMLTDPDHDGAGAPEVWSLASEAARRWVAGDSRVPRRPGDCWLGLMNELRQLRAPPVFSRTSASVTGWHGDPVEASVTLSEGGHVAAMSRYDGYKSAMSKVVMRAGRHFAVFTLLRGNDASIGVMRPSWDIENEDEYRRRVALNMDLSFDDEYRDLNGEGHLFYWANSGLCCSPEYEWEGQEGAEEGDRIGLLLDLDEGCMVVYRNDKRLGVMAAPGSPRWHPPRGGGGDGEGEGEGEEGLCWAVVFGDSGDRVRVEGSSWPPPPTPTKEELDAAVRWQVENNDAALFGHDGDGDSDSE
eukprot:COSAG01_NODE_1049_length_11922_cov_10.559587_10_plen_346_part_00